MLLMCVIIIISIIIVVVIYIYIYILCVCCPCTPYLSFLAPQLPRRVRSAGLQQADADALSVHDTLSSADTL